MMIFLLTLALAASDSNASDPYIQAWANCVVEYARPRLASETTEAIVKGGLAACTAEENALHKFYIRDMGPATGEAVFAGVRGKVPSHLSVIIDKAKAQRGYK